MYEHMHKAHIKKAAGAAAYGTTVWHNHLYACILRGEGVNQPMVSHSAQTEGPRGGHGVSKPLGA